MTIEPRVAPAGPLRGVAGLGGDGDVRRVGMWAVTLGLVAIELAEAPTVLGVHGVNILVVAALAGLPAAALLTRPLAGWGRPSSVRSCSRTPFPSWTATRGHGRSCTGWC